MDVAVMLACSVDILLVVPGCSFFCAWVFILFVPVRNVPGIIA